MKCYESINFSRYMQFTQLWHTKNSHDSFIYWATSLTFQKFIVHQKGDEQRKAILYLLQFNLPSKICIDPRFLKEGVNWSPKIGWGNTIKTLVIFLIVDGTEKLKSSITHLAIGTDSQVIHYAVAMEKVAEHRILTKWFKCNIFSSYK